MCDAWADYLKNNPDLALIREREQFCRKCPADMTAMRPEPPEWLRCVVSGCSLLNVRAHPWNGSTTPPISRQLSAGAGVIVYAVAGRWAMISQAGNEWVPLKFLAQAQPADS